MNDFDFYPHTCVIYRGATVDPVTGIETPNPYYEGRCYLTKDQTWFRGNRYSVESSVMLDNSELQVMKGDVVEVTLENGTIFKATAKQAYPIKDSDFGGQDLEVYQ
jgi:hypothetical protein